MNFEPVARALAVMNDLGEYHLGLVRLAKIEARKNKFSEQIHPLVTRGRLKGRLQLAEFQALGKPAMQHP